MMFDPYCQSSRKERVKLCHDTRLAKCTMKSGSVSPILVQQTPATVPTIWLADWPCSILKTPSEAPNPPTTKAGTGSERIELTLREKPSVEVRCTSYPSLGCAVSPTSMPRLRSTPPLIHSAVQPDDEGGPCCRSRSTMVRWYRFN